MSKRCHNKNLIRLLATIALSGMSSVVIASGFQLNEAGVTCLGTAYAGTAALAIDASTGFYNAAGLMRLPHEQVAISLVGAHTNSKVNVTSARNNLGTTLIGVPVDVRHRGEALIPGFHYAYRCDDNWAFGLNVASPFGLKSNYPDSSVVSYMSTRSELRTYDIAPSVAFCFGNGLSIGAGPDFVHAFAELDTRLAVPGQVVLRVAPSAADAFLETRLARWGVGGHIGALFEFNDCTRVGINYRSQVRLKAIGDTYAFGSTGTFRSVTSRAQLTLPDTVVVSGYHQFDECWALMADVQYTRWSVLKQLDLRLDPGLLAATTPAITITQPFNFKDTYRVALGGSYRWDDCFTLRAGVAYDRSPVRNANERTTIIPDSDRTWLAVGGRFNVMECLAVDVGYAHLFFKRADINQGAPTARGATIPFAQTIQGKYRTGADLLGVQLTWDIA